MSELNRRSFLKGAGLLGSAVALGGLVGCSPTTASSAKATGMPEKWDKEVDVVVLGTGSIIPAALKAHDAGLKVVILEKHPTWFGGTTSFSGGGISCANSSLALKAGKPEIPREIVKDYLKAAADGQSSDELIDMMIDNAPPAIDYLIKDCKFDIIYNPSKKPGYNLYTPYTELEKKYGDVGCWVSVMNAPKGGFLGRAIREFSMDAVEARGIEVMYGTAGKHLIYSGDPALDDGEVVGIYAETKSGTIAIKARYGVIIGTGGFDHNKEMVQHFLPAPIHATCAIETNTGDGHIMGMELGADLRNMNECYRMTYNMIAGKDIYAASDTSKATDDFQSEAVNHLFNLVGGVGSILVNKYGERFLNESSSYDLLGRGFEYYDTGRLEWRNVPGYFICDKTYNLQLGIGLPSMAEIQKKGEVPEWLHKFDTLEELADAMKINKDNLLATVKRYNGFCETGVDLDWNRGVAAYDKFSEGNMKRFESGEIKNPCLTPLKEGPFYCMEIYPGMMQTKGGLVINKDAQVLNVRGKVIPRLYAGANTIANPIGKGYGFGGGTLANGFVVGYVAGSHISTLTPWEKEKK